MKKSVFKGDVFKGYKLNPSVKSNEGFLVGMLENLCAISTHAVDTMIQPKGFHLILEKPNNSKLHEIPRVLNRWAVARSKSKSSKMSGKVLFLKAHEVRPRKKEFHIHIYVIADSASYDDIVFLRNKLLNICQNVALKYRKEDCRPVKYDSESGDIVLNLSTGRPRMLGSPWCHFLKQEFPDFIKRASYICKVKTKVSESSWSSSRLPKGANQLGLRSTVQPLFAPLKPVSSLRGYKVIGLPLSTKLRNALASARPCF